MKILMKTETTRSGISRTLEWAGLMLVALCLLAPSRAEAVGSWTRLANNAQGNICLMLLLSDGRVMAANNPQSTFDGTPDGIGQGWYFLTPDSNGSYVNGSWTIDNSKMNDSRLWYSSQVLTNGRVFVAGGEWGTMSGVNPVTGNGYARAEVYDPLGDTWTQVSPPTSLLNPSASQGFSDSISEILPNGKVLIAPVANNGWGETMIFDPNGNSWSAGPATASSYQDEASWVKLPDDSILTIDPFGVNSERYIPSLNSWMNDATVPVPMYDSVGSELGPGFLLPSGKVIFFGGTGNTAIYTPSGTTSPGTWTQGPPIPKDSQGKPLAAQDAPAAMMVNGKILCVFGHLETQSGGFPPPAFFFEYDPVANSFTEVNSPTGGLTDNGSSFVNFFGGRVMPVMLDLPNGQVLYSHMGADLYVYTPDGSPLPAGKPTITSITQNSDGSYHLVGTGLNGISEGAAFGDDAQMNSNYPLVRMTDSGGGVHYARTYNWSSTSVMTGSKPVSTEFTTSALAGVYQLVVVANGFASDPMPFTVPVWVDFNYSGFIQFGDYLFPYSTLPQGVSAIASSFSGGTIAINASTQPSTGHESVPYTISTPMTIISVGGPSTIGN
jgi:hypothetical protein